MNFDSFDHHRQGPSKRLLKLESGCLCNDVDSPWSNTNLKDRPILLKVFLGQIVQGGAETVQSPQDRIRIQRRCIDVHGGPGITVGGHGIGADKEKSNLLVGQDV